MALRREVSRNAMIFKILLVPGIIVIMFILTSIIRQMIRVHSINKEIYAMETEIKRLEDKNNSIIDNLNYYKSVSFLEKEARTKMNLKKSGEKVVVIVGNEKKEIIKQDDNIPRREVSNFKKWFYYFFRKDLLS